MVPCVYSRPHSVHGRTLRVSGRGINYGPLHPQPSAVNTRHTRALGQGRKGAQGRGRARGSSPFQRSEGRRHCQISPSRVGHPGRCPRASRGDARARQRPHGRGRRRGPAAVDGKRVLGEHGGQQVGTAGRGRHRAEIRRGEGRAPRAEGAAEGRRRPDGQWAPAATADAAAQKTPWGWEPGRGHLSSCRSPSLPLHETGTGDGAARRRRLQPSAGPSGAAAETGSWTGFSAARRHGLRPLQAVWQ